MRRNRIRPLAVSALALVLALAGCEPSAVPTGVAPPQTGAVNGVGIRSVQPVEGTLTSFSLEQVIGPEGGVMDGPGADLIIPAGAVSGPTTFRFRSADNGYIQVELTATAMGSSRLNDVGSAGFPVPLALTFDLHPAGGMENWVRYVVAWVRPDGTLESVHTTYNPVARRITGKIDHFSQFVVASGN